MNKTVSLNKSGKIFLNCNLEDPRTNLIYLFSGTLEDVMKELEVYNNAMLIQQFLESYSEILTENQLIELDTLMLKCYDLEGFLKYARKRPKLTSHENFVSTIISLKPAPNNLTLVRLCKLCKGNSFTQLENFIISRKNAREIYLISCTSEANLLKLKKAIFETEDYYYICCFCGAHQLKPNIIKASEIEKLEYEALSSEDRQKAISLAENVQGVNVKKLEQHVLNSGSAYQMYCFASRVKGASIDLIRRAILKTKDMEDIYFFVSKFGLGNSLANKFNYFRKKVVYKFRHRA